MTDNTPPSNEGPDKREFFRVSHDVLFDYKIVEAYTAENENAALQFEDGNAMSLLDELRRLDRDGGQTLKLLGEKNRLLADYLRNLNDKIDLIARHLLFNQDKAALEQPAVRINLSEDGVAFTSDRAIYVGNFLVLRLIFLPHYQPVITFARVIRCEQKDDHYRVAARFYRLAERDRQVLSRRILKVQVDHKKGSRQSSPKK